MVGFIVDGGYTIPVEPSREHLRRFEDLVQGLGREHDVYGNYVADISRLGVPEKIDAIRSNYHLIERRSIVSAGFYGDAHRRCKDFEEEFMELMRRRDVAVSKAQLWGNAPFRPEYAALQQEIREIDGALEPIVNKHKAVQDEMYARLTKNFI